ncbi:MAG: TonB-dependent receptor [Porphyromonas sp.]|nr:TonB-dependent receptor [Porphyromonas sp.]
MKLTNGVLCTLSLLLAGIVINLFSFTEAKADDVDSLQYYGLDELVVTGIKQQSKLQELPISGTSVTAHQLQTRNIVSIKDFTGMVPNFIMIDRDTPHTSSILVRGMGSKLRPAVVMYVDGVPHFEKSTFEITMNDIDKIEFLRGPQSTTFGRNAMGGVILVQTKSPFKTQGTTVRVGYGSYGEVTASASHLDRISDHWAYSVAGNYRHFGGYIDNAFDGSKADKADQGALNVKLEFSPTANTLFRLTNNIDLVRQGAFTYGKVDPESDRVVSVDLNHPSVYTRKMYDGGLYVSHNTPAVTLKGQVSAHLVDGNYDVDQDGSSAEVANALQGERQKLFSQEISLESKREGLYHWTVGAFAFEQKIDRDIQVQMFKPRDIVINRTNDEFTWGAALYHNSALSIGNFRLEGGLRVDYEKANLIYFESKLGKEIEEETDLPFFHFTPKFSLQYFFNPQSQIYATVSQGYITGGFNTVQAPGIERSYGAENSWNYEVGAKGVLVPGRLSGELVLFLVDTKNKQLNKTIPGLGQSTHNAGSSTSKGIEASVEAQLTKDWTLSGAYGFTHALFTSYEVDEKVDYTGNQLPFVPKHSIALNTEYRIPVRSTLLREIQLHVGYKGIGDMYWNEDNKKKQDFYHLLDASVTLNMGKTTWTVWGNNLLNSDYLGYYYTVTNKAMGKPGRPLMVGASVAVNL